jgi:OOP family OmpA-OmpF porin
MKKILASCLAILCVVNYVDGQTVSPVRRAAVGVSFFLNDFQTPQRIRSTSLSAVIRDKSFAKFREMSPGLAISYFRGLTPHIDLSGTGAFSFVDYPFRNRAPFGNDNFLMELDASAQFKLVDENYWIIPYISAGLGAHMYKVYYGAFAPVGIGFRINLFDEAGVFVNTQYRVPITYETANYHFFNSFGIYGAVGKKKEEPVKVIEVPVAEPPKDSDGDGIIDDKDKCPTVPGVAKYDGCPVPDTDKDGINDDNDKCPTVPGVARYQGCPIPDTDKDGINDEEDKCPSVPGVARYQGCPIPDTDGDGINDEEDKCPQLAGTKENMGCPEIKADIKSKVDFAARNIYFASGSYKLLSKSNKGLNDVAQIMKDNPQMKLSIDGHTDNSGKPDKNQVLSQSRANAVMQYLVSKGVDASRLNASGHGQDLPIASNKTPAGRQKNRRVELKLGYY